MTLSEFKAWFEGFTESIEGAPSEDQFARIKAKVEKIDGTVTTYPVFIDRWWPHYDRHRFYDYSRQFWSTGNVPYIDDHAVTALASSEGTKFGGYGHKVIEPVAKGDNQTVTFDIHDAMRALGRAEAVN